MHEIPFLTRAGVRPTTHNPQPTTHNPQPPTTDHRPRNYVNDPRVQQAIALLTQQLSYQWQISELAAAVRMERRQLERGFRAATDHSPLAWLRRRRLHKAAELLVTTAALIRQIAAQVGICDKHHFRRSFQQLYSVCPAEYRQREASTCLVPYRARALNEE